MMIKQPHSSPMFSRSSMAVILTLTACIAIVLWGYPLLHLQGLTSEKYTGWASNSIFLFMLAWLSAYLFALALVVIASFGFLQRSTSAFAMVCLVAAAICVGSAHEGRKLLFQVRKQVFTEMAERSAPLIAAIKSYEKDKGEPPPALNALVPDYLPAIPGTGLAAHQEYWYKKKSWTEPNEWELSVSTGFGLGFDQMLYLPHENYPTEGYGGRLERMGQWAYVHE